MSISAPVLLKGAIHDATAIQLIPKIAANEAANKTVDILDRISCLIAVITHPQFRIF
ncbi:hypothetical protein [Loktanella sp. IMCC34160]|uniref:hypothetical protein n=1 Tax=Loktanella sp. IMCC34160 TaxID=2510646 RepID=UPI0013EA32C3|nr:hypothetical protein [Loktanella sp. IMCC34160]